MAVKLKRSRYAKRFETRGLGTIPRQRLSTIPRWRPKTPRFCTPALRTMVGPLIKCAFWKIESLSQFGFEAKTALGLQNQGRFENGIFQIFPGQTQN